MPGIKKTVIGTRLDLVNGTDGFHGPHNHAISIDVDLSQFTNKEIDEKGYLKPYIPLARDGTMMGGGSFVYGVTTAPVQVAADNAAGTLAGLGTERIAVFLQAFVVRDYAEDVLGRAYTANEIAAFAAAGSRSVLIYDA